MKIERTIPLQMEDKPNFTAEQLIEAPRRSPFVPSPDGKHALFTVSSYDLESHIESVEIKIFGLEKMEERLFSDDKENKSPSWLTKDELIWMRGKGEGEEGEKSTDVWVGKVVGEKSAYRAGTIKAKIDNVKTKELPNGNIAFIFSAPVNPDGTFYSGPSEKPPSSAREFDTLNVRYWDTYFPEQKSSLFYTVLFLSPNGKYKLGEEIVNALQGANVDFFPFTVDHMSGAGSLDVADHGIIFQTNEPELDEETKLQHWVLWYVPVPDFTATPWRLRKIKVPGLNGNFSSPVFSPDGKSAAFLSTRNFQIDEFFNQIFVMPSFTDSRVLEIAPLLVKEGKLALWDLDPQSLLWSNDGKSIYVIAEEKARVKLWMLPVPNPNLPYQGPVTILATLVADATSGSVNSVFPVSKDPKDSRILVNRSGFTDSGSCYIVDRDSDSHHSIGNHISHHLFGLSPSQVSSISFKYRYGYSVTAWVIKPSFFSPSKKYPLAFLIHGGPQGSWADSWSTRWNPAVWAEQGYVVVLPNPTGSTSFGSAFTYAVAGDWGGRAYQDLEKCFTYVSSQLRYVDTSRAIAAGGSYGGYMMNFIAGQPLAKKFKTLICHDGIFNFVSMLATDHPANIIDMFNRPPWKALDAEPFDEFCPSRNMRNWSTPMLFIHSDKDYRCPVTQGLMAYNVCQLRGIDSRFLNFPDENHFVLKRENSYRWYLTVLGWANKYAGNEGEGKIRLEEPITKPRARETGDRYRVEGATCATVD